TYYLSSHWFWLMLTLFAVVFMIELRPMITLIRWRMSKKAETQASDQPVVETLITLGKIEMGILAVIPLVAAIMDRGGFR
ncbi:MAG: DUF2214 family protein, partial [Proteobacteria bacterium]